MGRTDSGMLCVPRALVFQASLTQGLIVGKREKVVLQKVFHSSFKPSVGNLFGKKKQKLEYAHLAVI